MEKYKYTYQDWIDGKIDPSRLRVLHFNQDISFDDYILIKNDQDQAYLKRLTDALACLKEDFARVYNKTLVKDYFLNFYIQMYTKLVDNFDKIGEGKIISFETMYPDEDGREELTINQVVKYLSFDVKNYESCFELTNIIRDSEKDLTPFNFVINTNFLRWLYWFQEQEKLDNSEPAINQLSRGATLEIEKAPKSQKRNHVSYSWQNSPNTELPELYQLLLDNKLINKGTTLGQLKAVFSEQPFGSFEAIKWHDDNASELLYFIIQLESTGNIEASERSDYKRLQECFIKPDGKPFKNAFKSLKQRIEVDLSEQKQQKIRDIISNFL